MINGLSFDVEDWFNVENLREACPAGSWDSFELRVEANTDRILGLLAKHGAKATFFVLGWIAEKRPGLVKSIADAGHEVASHGYSHQLITRMTKESFRDDVERSKRLLEDITGLKVAGYRAPNFSITDSTAWALDILRGAGFEYDSSIFPTSFHDRYGFKNIDGCGIFKFENGLAEIPLSVYRIAGFNFPVAGGAYFRLLPYAALRAAYRGMNRGGKPFVFYLHPWEMDEGQPRVDVKASYRLRHYGNIARTAHKMERLLGDFEFGPLKGML